jgi:hypothetical protein
MSDRLAAAHEAFAAAMAALRRCEHLFAAPMTAEKQALLARRLGDAGDDLALAFVTVSEMTPQPPFIAPSPPPSAPTPSAPPKPPAPSNVVPLTRAPTPAPQRTA